MNSVFVQQALEKVGSKEILVVLVGERVRQLSSDHTPARPLVDCAGTESALNIALREIAEEKITFQLGNQDAPISPAMPHPLSGFLESSPTHC